MTRNALPTRLLAAVLLLASQALATFAPCLMVRCVHADGVEAVEIAGSDCCRAAHEAERAPACCDDDSAEPTVRAANEVCRDVPVRPDQVSVARAKTTPSPTAQTDRDVAVAAIFAPAPTRFAPAVVARLDVRGPPRDAVPRLAARPFVPRV